MLNPIIFVGLVVLAEQLLKRIPGYTPGLMTTLVDVALLFGTLLVLWNFRSDRLVDTGKKALLGFLVGDITYAGANYLLKIGTANTYWCLVYIIPYLVGMGLLAYLGGRNWRAFERQQRLFGFFLISCLIVVSSIGITVPALFDKNPPLPIALSVLTVSYSLLESCVLGISLMLAALSVYLPVQMISIGIAIMHGSDLALRYQSLRPESMGFGIFEYGWILGLVLVFSGIKKAANENVETVGIPVRIAGSRSIQATMVKLLFFAQIGVVSAACFYLWHAGGKSWNEVLSIAINLLSISTLFVTLLAGRLSRDILAMTTDLKSRQPVDGGRNTSEELQDLGEAIFSAQESLRTEADKSRIALASLAHDLKSPMAAIQIAADQLRSVAERDSQVVELLGIASSRISSLSNSVLKNREVRAPGQSLAAAVDESVKVASRKYGAESIVLNGEPPKDRHVFDGFERVFYNVLENSLQASQGRQPVSVEWHSEQQGSTLTVIDHGGGIPTEILESARAGRAMTTKADGNGIGLTTCFAWSSKNQVPLAVEKTATDTRVTWRFNS